MKSEEIRLELLREAFPGISPEAGAALAQAASICLERENYSSCTDMNIDGDWNRAVSLCWRTTDARMRRAWGDIQEATEYGACGIAALLIARLTSLVVVERSVKGTGFDYWLSHKDDVEPLFQRKARLEVSGIQNGGEAEIRQRLREKLKQINRSDGKFPAYIAIVEFSTPRSRMVQK